MKHTSVFFALAISVSSCATKNGLETPPITSSLAEVCPSCGTSHSYAASFDDLDYTLIAAYCDGFRLKKQVYLKAPHGPTPACDSTYLADLSWSHLHKEMPDLKKETFASFQTRNSPIPTHEGLTALAAKHGIAVTQEAGEPGKAVRLSRGGFSADAQQAMVYSGGGVVHLFQHNNGTWQQADSAVIWME